MFVTKKYDVHTRIHTNREWERVKDRVEYELLVNFLTKSKIGAGSSIMSMNEISELDEVLQMTYD